MKKLQIGFTLLEMLFIVAIIGILASLAIPIYLNYTARAQATEAFVQMDGIKHKLQLYFQEEGNCISNTDVISGDMADQNSIADNDSYAGRYTESITTSGIATVDGGCSITAKFKTAGLNNALQGKSLVFTLYGFNTHTPQWACHTPDIAPTNYIILPKICQYDSFANATNKP